MSHFHTGETEIQRRLDARDDAERVGRIISSEIPRGLASALATHQLAVAASLDAQRRQWASLLTGPAGFIAAVDEHLLRLAVSPSVDDTLATNLGAHPDLGILAFDPRTRRPASLQRTWSVRPGGPVPPRQPGVRQLPSLRRFLAERQ
jgi:uncharacterized protein